MRCLTASIELAQHSDRMTLIIQDNGMGFSPAQTQIGYGLQGMRERILSLAGHIEINAMRRLTKVVVFWRNFPAQLLWRLIPKPSCPFAFYLSMTKALFGVACALFWNWSQD